METAGDLSGLARHSSNCCFNEAVVVKDLPIPRTLIHNAHSPRRMVLDPLRGRTASKSRRRYDMNKLISRAVLAVMTICLVGGAAWAQKDKGNDSLACRDNWRNDKLVNHCEIKEQTLPATDGTIAVDG